MIIALLLCLLFTGCGETVVTEPEPTIELAPVALNDSQWNDMFADLRYSDWDLLPYEVKVRESLDTTQIAWVSLETDSSGGCWYRVFTYTTVSAKKLPEDFEYEFSEE